MRISVALLVLLLLYCPMLHARDTPWLAETFSQATSDGAYTLELSLKGGKLEPGPNSIDLKVIDKAGLAVEGAEIGITPWMPSMGHGVWDKPVVTERAGGLYHIENIKIVMGGRWELRVKVRKGSLEEQAVFPFEVAEKQEQLLLKNNGMQGDSYERRVVSYSIPDASLLNQDGKQVRLKTITAAGKPVIVDFIFTTCTTVCPLMSAGLANLRAELGERAGGVEIISITIDPENDRPAQLKEYASHFNAGEGWTFLTGSREEIGRVLQAFDAVIVDKMAHEPLFLLRGPDSAEWIRIKGLVGAGDLLKEFRRIENK
jgi:protein SCO1